MFTFVFCEIFKNTCLYRTPPAAASVRAPLSMFERVLNTPWMVVIGLLVTRFFYKQHFYKQCQAKIGKKSSKISVWTLAIWKLFTFFIIVIIQKWQNMF